MKALGIDPGRSTGVAVLEDETFKTFTLGPEAHYVDLWALLRSENWTYVFYEKFLYQKRPGAVSVDLTACEYILINMGEGQN